MALPATIDTFGQLQSLRLRGKRCAAKVAAIQIEIGRDRDGRITVDQEKPHLKKNQTVVWETTEDEQFTVTFEGENGSPFEDDTFTVSKHAAVIAGPVKFQATEDTPLSERTFKYTVTGDHGSTLDPAVIIDP